MMKNARMPVHELNPYLTCVLCGGYLIDATTIIECLHSFCRTCIVHYLHTSNYCPVCECLVHKKNPHQNLRSDRTLQDVVYKLVPGLFMEEMRRRRQYYNLQADEAQSRSGRIIFTPDEKISLCMRLCTRKICSSKTDDFEFQDKRYLLCPAQMSVYHLKKFLRLKYCLSDRLEVELFHKNEVLKDDYSLVDVSYITGWTREKAMVLNYAFYENPNKKFKRNTFSGAVSPGNDDSGIEDENSNQDGPNPADQNHVTSQSSQASKESDNQQPPADDTQSESPPAENPERVPDEVTDANLGAEEDTSSDEKQDSVEESKDVVGSDDGGGRSQDDGKTKTEEGSHEKDEEDEEDKKVDEMKDTQKFSESQLQNEEEEECPAKMDTESSAVKESGVIEDVNMAADDQKNSRSEKLPEKEINDNATEMIKYEIPENKTIVFENGEVETLDKSSNNDKEEKVPSPACSSITIEDDEGALQIVIDDSKSEKSSEDSGLQMSESSPNESVCSVEGRSPSMTIKIPNLEIFKLKPPVSFHNGSSSSRSSKSPKTSTPFHSTHLSPSRKFPRFSESVSFNDSGFSLYSSFSDSNTHTTSCPQTDFDADEIWTDGVMDLSKPKMKPAEQFQEVKSAEVEEEEGEEVEKYTYVADDLEEGEDNMEIDSGYANENKTPERYSLLSPDQNEVTSTRMDHVTYPMPIGLQKPQLFAPTLPVASSLVWKKDKSFTDSSKKSSSGKHHKRRKSSEGSKNKVDLSKAHSKCTDVCNGHSVVPKPHSASQTNKQGEKLILNQPRCEKLIISQSRCEKVPKSKPRCEKLVVKLSKERNSEHYTATMS